MKNKVLFDKQSHIVQKAIGKNDFSVHNNVLLILRNISCGDFLIVKKLTKVYDSCLSLL
jgi:hypothetical protein